MKKILIILMVCFVFSAFGAPVQAATVWSPTESGQIDVNFLNFDFVDIALFDDDDIAFSMPLYVELIADTISFEQVGSDWVLKSSETDNTITLTDSSNFIIALDDNGNWQGVSDIEKIAFGIYNLNWGLVAQVTMIDAQPVPLPAAILLLGTGLLGIIGFKRRK